jgi:hypothetical protein
MTQNTKQIIIAIVIIIIAFFGFKMFFVSDDTGDTTLTVETGATAEFIDGQQVLTLLNNLSKVTLDQSIFTNSSFTSLVSFERNLQDQVLERKNPFLPIGVDGSNVLPPRATTTVRTR